MAALAGCAALPMPTPMERRYAIFEPTLTCDQANKISYRVVEGLGYTVTSFTPASAGGGGVVRGARERPVGQDTVAVKINCGADGVHVNTDSGGLLATNLEFPQAFFSRFKGMTDVVQRGEAPKPQGQVQVTMTPLIGLETKLEFGTEVTGVFPVRVEIFNTTERTYLLEADKIMLLTSSGERVKPLSATNGGSARMITSQTLAPGANVKGYLYYPPGSYTGARGFIVEAESQEREGFDVQF
jgi:hypothetical protein